MTPANPTCATCRFWGENERYDEGLNDPGWCHRYAPRPRLLMADDQSVTTTLNEVLWPAVGDGAWCGEHAPRVGSKPYPAEFLDRVASLLSATDRTKMDVNVDRAAIAVREAWPKSPDAR